MNYWVRYIKVCKIQTSHLQVLCKIFAKFPEKTPVSGLFLNKVASELGKILWATFFYTYGPLLLKMEDSAHFNFLSFKIYDKGN